MNATTTAAAADAAVLGAALITLLAIVVKLVTANLIQRSKRSFAKLDIRRKDIAGLLKAAELKRTSARGTLEFWERRRTETEQRVFDVKRDVEAYVDQLGDVDFEEEDRHEITVAGETDAETEAEVQAEIDIDAADAGNLDGYERVADERVADEQAALNDAVDRAASNEA